MAITLVQSSQGASFSGSGVGPTNPQLFSTSGSGFSAPTTAGNLLICLQYSAVQRTAGAGVASMGAINPVTSGLSWHSANFNFYNIPTGQTLGSVVVWYVENAPSISPSILTSAVVSVSPNFSSGFNVQTEFDLYEFTPIATASSLDSSAKYSTGFNGPTPNNGNLATTNASDLVISAYIGDPSSGGSEVSAGAGYTLGINAALVRFGQMQWKPSVPAGSNLVAFGGTVPTTWAGTAVSFQEGTPPPSTGFVQVLGGNFQDCQARPVANGYLSVKLVSDSEETIIGNGQIFSGTRKIIPLDMTGNVAGTQYLWSNATLNPSNSYYVFSLFDSTGIMLWQAPLTGTIPDVPTYNLAGLIRN